MRDILEAANVRNGGAIHYYFGAKEDLLRELVSMGARLIDLRRIQMLAELEAGTDDVTLEQIVSILVHSAVGVSKAPSGEDSYTRFALRVQDTHCALYDEAVRGRWDRGYRRAAEIVRIRLPWLARTEIDNRLALAMELVNAALARREALLADGVGDSRWGTPQMLESLVAGVVGLLEAKAGEPDA